MMLKDDINQIGQLCKLSFDDVESEETIKTLNHILNFLDNIKEVDTEGVEPTYQVNEYKNPLIDDVIKESLSSKDVVKNTVEEKYGYFKILKVVD